MADGERLLDDEPDEETHETLLLHGETGYQKESVPLCGLVDSSLD